MDVVLGAVLGARVSLWDIGYAGFTEGVVWEHSARH